MRPTKMVDMRNQLCVKPSYITTAIITDITNICIHIISYTLVNASNTKQDMITYAHK